MIRNWLAAQKGDQLFYQSVGQSPSLADVIKMVHPRPDSKEKEAFYGWLLGKEYDHNQLPALLKQFEAYKLDSVNTPVPAVDFRMLTALNLGVNQWGEIARNASWNTLRMNLNTFQRHGVLSDSKLVRQLADKLRDADTVRKANAFPYQLLTTYQATLNQIPRELSLALQDALEVATQNVPVLNGEVAVCVDTSGSMNSAITGTRDGATSVTKCVDVAGLMAACVVRQNPNAVVVPFDTAVHMVDFNPRDSVLTNAQKFARRGGGTCCEVAMQYLNQQNWKGKTVIYVSDNESWYVNRPRSSYGWSYRTSGTGMAEEWAKLGKRNHNAKLVCIDLVPNTTVQVVDDKDVLNIGGFNDSVFQVVANFVNGDSRDFSKVIYDSVNLE
jgi:60 kDa SS-A/Ro ribonucleoprotein